MKSLKEYKNNKFWHKYISALYKKPVKAGCERWYVLHIEHYAKSIPDKKLLDHTPENLNQYFTLLDRKQGMKKWIYKQHIEALQILFGAVLQVDWYNEID